MTFMKPIVAGDETWVYNLTWIQVNNLRRRAEAEKAECDERAKRNPFGGLPAAHGWVNVGTRVLL